jgi:transposase-like protein
MKSFSLEPITNEQQAYEFLKQILHPEGLHCPRCGAALPADQAPHTRERAPLVNYRCRKCGRVYNLFTKTVLQGTHYACQTWVLLLHAFVAGRPTREIAAELELDYGNVLDWRHTLQDAALHQRITTGLSDEHGEADETYVNAGQPGDEQDDDDAEPPRERANKARGRGTAEQDRPPILGTVGRESGELRLEVAPDATGETVSSFLRETTPEDIMLYTDGHRAYQTIEDTPREHLTVKHSEHEFARDADGDGSNEVHDNTIEGIWTGLKNFLRPFRGVHQKFLPQYVAMFEWLYNLEEQLVEFLRLLLVPDFTYLPT